MKADQYQGRRARLLAHIDRLRETRDDLETSDPAFVAGLPADVRQRMLLLDRESTRLRNPDLTIAFVGGFNAGKSSLVNAFLGRYLLPESAKVTTAVPTFVRSTDGEEGAELHYLSGMEAEALGQLYRSELATLFRLPELVNAPFTTLMETARPLAGDGRGRGLLDQYELYQKEQQSRRAEVRGRVVSATIADAQKAIRDEKEAMFLDRVVVRVRGTPLPPDVVLVDLPGISVPNPRHRAITFRFVGEEAHAVVFVLMAPRPFDKDEIEIMEIVRAGEARVADKTFWVMNRWDGLTAEQQRQTLAEFERKMQEFAVPPGYLSFRTNALHGLLAQLGERRETPSDATLQRHWPEYEAAVQAQYGGSHATALRESQIPPLREAVLGFLNDRLRETTLRSAVENSRANFCDPMPHHLRRVKDIEDVALAGGLKQEEKEQARQAADELFNRRRAELAAEIRTVRNEVAVKRAANLKCKAKEIVETLRAKIESGPETDAFEIYKEIIAERELRKYPYHFEIEMRVVDNLNTMLKRHFRQLVREQVTEVFDDLVTRVEAGLEGVREDVGYSSQVMAPFDDVLREVRSSFVNKVDGVVMTLAARLDELLLFKKAFLGMLGGNEILDGLEKAARLGYASLKNPGQALEPADFEAKTRTIRQTLSEHYINKVSEYHAQIAHDIFPVIINNMQEIQRRLDEALQGKYRPALEVVQAQQTEREFVNKRRGLEERSRRLRETIERIEQTAMDMTGVLVG